jgi:acylphosphatase
MKFTKVFSLVVAIMLVSVFVLAATCGENCCLKTKDIKITATNTENGVEIKYVGQTPEATKAIQEKLAKCSDTKGCDMCGMKGVKREVKNTEDGAIMTLTAKKEKNAKKLQEAIKKEMGECASSASHKGCSKEQQKKCGVIK